jgi:hypothetical protein
MIILADRFVVSMNILSQCSGTPPALVSGLVSPVWCPGQDQNQLNAC